MAGVMNGAPFRHIGGMVTADHGPMPLATARGLADFYRSEATYWRGMADDMTSSACALRASGLETAILAAAAWRRAAGWTDPDTADGEAGRSEAR